jgi:hypothetical protein
VAIQNHAQRGDPRARAERLLRGAQRGRTDALEQVADLLQLAADLGEQLLPAHAEMPQPGRCAVAMSMPAIVMGLPVVWRPAACPLVRRIVCLMGLGYWLALA